jgi:hypothetical protein
MSCRTPKAMKISLFSGITQITQIFIREIRVIFDYFQESAYET